MPSLIADFQEAIRTNNAALNADLIDEDVRLLRRAMGADRR